MNVKEKAITAIQSLADGATWDQVIYRLCVIRKIEIGLAQAETGHVTPHDEFMAELDLEDVR